MWLGVPASVVSLMYVYLLSCRIRMGQRAIALTIGGLVLLLLFCVYGEYEKTHELLRELGGGTGKPDSVIYRFGWLNQYTNNLFLNGYTFVAGISLAALIGRVSNRLSR
ncbi:hypothetical protein [Cohnella soli]|uniref:Uncharacterized protein n=1 Tax=Cohnella soli TaxID=425005 RepID=A0ABW0HPS9_9BACL